MKRMFVLLLLALILFSSCAGIPKPESDTDSLVVGSFVLDFPDGFFGMPARKIDSGVRLDFLNVTKDKPFFLTTEKGGFFNFLAAGGDRYELVSFAYKVQSDRGYYWGGNNIRDRFTAGMGVVQYLGHYVYAYKHSRLVSATGTGTTRWTADPSFGWTLKGEEVQAYLKKTAPDSPWLSREMRSGH